MRKERTEVRKEQIIRAAIDIIAQDGVQGLTTLRIAKSAGISEANLYRHFKNKDAILTAVVHYIEETLSGNLRAVNAESVAPLEKLTRIFQIHLSMIEENRGIPRIVFSSETIYRKDLREKMSSLITRYLKMLTEILKAGVRDGSIKAGINAEATATLFIGMVQICVLRWIFSNFQTSLSEEGGKLWWVFRKNLEG